MNSGSLVRLYGLNPGPINGSRRPSFLVLFINATCASKSSLPAPAASLYLRFSEISLTLSHHLMFSSVTQFSVNSQKAGGSDLGRKKKELPIVPSQLPRNVTIKLCSVNYKLCCLM